MTGIKQDSFKYKPFCDEILKKICGTLSENAVCLLGVFIFSIGVLCLEDTIPNVKSGSGYAGMIIGGARFLMGISGWLIRMIILISGFTGLALWRFLDGSLSEFLDMFKDKDHQHVTYTHGAVILAILALLWAVMTIGAYAFLSKHDGVD